MSDAERVDGAEDAPEGAEEVGSGAAAPVRLWHILLILGGLFVAFVLSIPQCLVEGTRVSTPAGDRRIEELRAGDAVWCRAPDGRRVEGRVTAAAAAWKVSCLELGFEGGAVLRATGWHPLATAHGWVPAGDLSVGDRVYAEGGARRLERVEGRLGLVRVYDLSVSPYPNFFAEGMLVHNKQFRIPSNEASAIGALKTIGTSQSLFREADKDGDGVLDYGTLRELASPGAGLIDPVLGTGTKGGYLFEASYGASTSEFIWFATARPIEPGASGERYFATNHEGVAFFTTSAPFRLNTVDCAIPAGSQPVGR